MKFRSSGFGFRRSGFKFCRSGFRFRRSGFSPTDQWLMRVGLKPDLQISRSIRDSLTGA